MVCVLTLLFLLYPAAGQVQDGTKAIRSLRKFVQEFYDWYAPKASSNNKGPAWMLAIQERSSAFSQELARALEEDAAAQAKSPSQIVGIDFDPLLNSQDPSDHYKVGKITPKGERYLVEIHSASSAESEKADVVAEVSRKREGWVFLDFCYGPNKSLLEILRALREERKEMAR